MFGIGVIELLVILACVIVLGAIAVAMMLFLRRGDR